MEPERLPVSNSRRVLLLSTLNYHQASSFYLTDQWGLMVDFSDTQSGTLTIRCEEHE
jgi:hypothetical protein